MDGLPVNVTDLAVIAILVISGLLAFARGFVREVLSIGAWVGAAAATIYGFPLAKPLASDYIPNELLANVVTGVVIFVVTLGILAALSHMLARHVRESALGALDRSLGLLFGLLRGAVLVCVAWMVFAFLTAPEDRPDWIVKARTLPLVTAGADMLARLLPEGAIERGADMVDEAGRRVEEEAAAEAIRRGFAAQEAVDESPQSERSAPAANSAAPGQGSGYKDQERQDMNRMIQGIR